MGSARVKVENASYKRDDQGRDYWESNILIKIWKKISCRKQKNMSGGETSKYKGPSNWNSPCLFVEWWGGQCSFSFIFHSLHTYNLIIISSSQLLSMPCLLHCICTKVISSPLNILNLIWLQNNKVEVFTREKGTSVCSADYSQGFNLEKSCSTRKLE
jgi:hypothetical protein